MLMLKFVGTIKSWEICSRETVTVWMTLTLWLLIKNFFQPLVSTTAERIFKRLLVQQNNNFSTSALKKQKSAVQFRVYLSINVLVCTFTVVCVYTVAQMPLFYWDMAAMSPHHTPTRRHKHSFHWECSLTSQLTNPYTQCLATGQSLASKLFLSRSEADRLALFGCGAGDVPAVHILLWHSSHFIKGLSKASVFHSIKYRTIQKTKLQNQ